MTNSVLYDIIKVLKERLKLMTPQEIAKYLKYADQNIELVVITKKQFNKLVNIANKYKKIIKIVRGIK